MTKHTPPLNICSTPIWRAAPLSPTTHRTPLRRTIFEQHDAFEFNMMTDFASQQLIFCC
ncbi:hypothetical protein [Methylopila sp. 73B]|uniref:hypothetical protein n=1 Tax=Methylopila sp. 73B TaxID=1120792 RepID=UPI0018CC61DA|nr:hypothetical protein [Methylopila sp. 73B]